VPEALTQLEGEREGVKVGECDLEGEGEPVKDALPLSLTVPDGECGTLGVAGAVTLRRPLADTRAVMVGGSRLPEGVAVSTSDAVAHAVAQGVEEELRDAEGQPVAEGERDSEGVAQGEGEALGEAMVDVLRKALGEKEGEEETNSEPVCKGVPEGVVEAQGDEEALLTPL